MGYVPRPTLSNAPEDANKLGSKKYSRWNQQRARHSLQPMKLPLSKVIDMGGVSRNTARTV